LTPFPIAVDDQGLMYVTLSDIGYILLLDPLNELRIGTQMIPVTINNIQTAFAYNGYSYFIASTEISSVFRISQANYCVSICVDGFCQNGVCQCPAGYVLKAGQCVTFDDSSVTVIIDRRSGTVATLAVFFVIALLIAGIGWANFVKVRFFNSKREQYVAL